MSQDYKNQKQKKKITSKQIVAMAGVILLALLYLVTLIVAFVDQSASGRLFWVCLFATMAIPLLIWVYTWMYGKLTGKSTIADFQPDHDREQEQNPAATSDNRSQTP